MHLPRRSWAFALVTLLSASAALSAQTFVVPPELMLPGTQPMEVVDPIVEPFVCLSCHGGYDAAVEPGHTWSGSMMAHAARDPVFWAAMAVAEQSVTGSGDLCLRCHTPNGWISGRSTPTDGSFLDPFGDADGISCNFCHRVTDPDGSGYPGVHNPPFEAHDGGGPPTAWVGAGEYVLTDQFEPVLGPYSDPLAPHQFAQDHYIRSSEMCGTCHDVSNPLVGDLAPNNGAATPLLPGSFSGVPGSPVAGKAALNNAPHKYGTVERTFSEHQASAFKDMPVSDYATLPPELQDGSLRMAYEAAIAAGPGGNYADGTTRSFSCQTCHLPPVDAAGCFFSPPRTDMPLHDLTGGNAFAPEAIAYLDTVGSGLTFGGGLQPEQLAALADAAVRAEGTLASAASLRVVDDELHVVNLTGHKLPSGYPEGRRMWLRTLWKDAGGSVIEIDGGNEDLVVDIDGTPTTVFDVLALDEDDTHVWEVKHGLTQEWANDLLAQGLPAGLPLSFDRVTGAVTETLGGLAASAPGTTHETFHFVLNNEVLSDNRIPPYLMDHDEALERNCRPVPPTQFGNPGPGGVYDHVDRLAFTPPPGATRATISLQYQSVSWEYAWFLYQANTGAVPFLADTGDKLMEAYLATHPASGPRTMAEIEWFAPWYDLGESLGGTHGDPQLTITGDPVADHRVNMSLTGALESAPAWLVAGAGFAELPLYGGTLVPHFEAPLGVIVPLLTSPTGTITINERWPSGIPAGMNFAIQVWITDAGAFEGYAASNAVAATSK